jgi:uncharacterized membrane protein
VISIFTLGPAIVRKYTDSQFETIIIGTGVSLSIVVLVGLVLNFAIPASLLGSPLEKLPLAYSLVLILYGTYEIFQFDCTLITLSKDDIRGILFSISIGVIAVVSAFLYRGNETTLFVLILIAVSLFPLLIAVLSPSNRFTMWMIWAASIAILLRVTLASPYLPGMDISIEVGWARTIIDQGLWEPSIHNNQNATLSISMLIPGLSLITGLGPVVVSKTIVPAYFSLVPVGVYYICSRTFDNSIGYLSAFIVIFYFGFYVALPHNIKTSTAELFVVIFLLLLLLEQFSLERRILCILAMAGIVTSHYGTAIVVLAAFTIGILSYTLLQSWRDLGIKSHYLLMAIIGNIIVLSWYMFVSGSAFITYAVYGSKLIRRLITSQTATGSGSVSQYVDVPAPLSIDLSQYLLIALAIFAAVGLTITFVNILRRKSYYSSLYIGVASGFALLIPGSMVVADFNIARVGHISFLLISPFAIITLKKALSVVITRRTIQFSTIAFFLMCLFLVQSGVFAVANPNPDVSPHPLTSRADIEHMDPNSSIEVLAIRLLNKRYIPPKDAAAARWLNYRRGKIISLTYNSYTPSTLTGPDTEGTMEYKYIRCYNSENNVIITGANPPEWEYFEINPLANKLYSNGCAYVTVDN